MTHNFRYTKNLFIIIICLVVIGWFIGGYPYYSIVWGEAIPSPAAVDEPTPVPTQDPVSSPASTPTPTPSPSPIPNSTPSPTPPAFEIQYAVGLIDLIWSHIESTGTADQYPSSINLDGHIAFYLKGKIKGKFLLTAQMDTGEKPIAELLQYLDREDPVNILSKIDPEQYYPVYGDQSTVVNDVAGKGKLYVRLDWSQSQILLGDYQVQLDRTGLIKYNRNLYGLNVNLKDPRPSGTGSNALQLYLAEPSSLHGSDIIRSTGSMLYYLKHADIVLGSEQIKVELRSLVTGAAISSTQLQLGRDYDLDYAQGRIILKRDLASVIQSGLITTTSPVDGNIPFLVADYEYEGDELVYRPNFGFHAGANLFSGFHLGGSLAAEAEPAGKNYLVHGLDYEYQITKDLDLTGEWAQSDQSLGDRFYTEDGGLTYSPFATNTQTQGNSWQFGFDWRFPGSTQTPNRLKCYTLYQGAGFSTAEAEVLHDIHQNHLEYSGTLLKDQTVSFNYDTRTEATVKDASVATVQFSKNYQKLKLTEELRNQNENDLINNEDYHDLLGAVRLDYQLSEATALYGTQQLTLSHNDVTPQNNRTILGTTIRFNPKTTFNLEASTGDLGKSAGLGCQYQITSDNQVYAKTSYETDQNAGQTLTAKIGERGAVSSSVNVYTEQQVGSGTYENSSSKVFGVDYTPKKGWVFSANFTESQVEKLADRPATFYPFPGTAIDGTSDSTATNSFSRTIFGLGAMYHQKALEYRSGLEVRHDNSDTQLVQYLFTNTYHNELNTDWAYYCKLNYSVTQNQTINSEMTRFAEAVLGFAYRPVANDRLNLIGEYRYRDELSSDQQLDGTVPRESSHIVSLEGIFDLDPHWQLGEKVALKKAMILPDPAGDWYTNDLWLWVNRINYHILFHWDLSTEYRILRDIQAGDEQAGFLVAVYYLFNLHNRIGAGYNFTNFNDNLAYLNYQSRGFFINYSYQW